MEALLRVEDLTVDYPGFCLDKISFSCDRGEILGVLGANGAGKSTAMKAIMHIIGRNGGNIYWKGEPVTSKMAASLREKIGYVGDNDCYYPNIKVKKILKFMSDIYGGWDKEAMAAYLEKFSLDVNKKMKELSTGMRVKLDMLMAMSHNAELYILDEPTSGLDPFVREEVLEILHELAKQKGKSVIISSHITSDLEKTADRVAYMVDGRIALISSVEDIQRNYVKVREEDLQKAGVSGLPGAEGYRKIGKYMITTREIHESPAAGGLAAGLPNGGGRELQTVPVLLEDVLFYLGR